MTRGSIFGKLRYKVRGSIKSEHHTIVHVDIKDIDILGERVAVTHAAWIAMFANETDEWGLEIQPVRQVPTARILRKLCDLEGTEKVKNMFVSTVVFERLDNDQTH